MKTHHAEKQRPRTRRGTSKPIENKDNITAKFPGALKDAGLLFEHMPNGFVHCEVLFERGEAKDFVYLNANGAFETLTGLRGVTGKRVSEVTPGLRGSHPEIFEVCGRVASTGNPEQFEVRLGVRGGTWLSVSAYSPGRGRFAAILDTITERKRAEEQAKHFASFPRMNPNAVLEVDETGTIVFSNPAAQELANPGSGGRGLGLFLPEDMQALLEEWDKESELVTHREVAVEEKFFQETIRFIPDSRVIRIYANDVTDYKRAAKALRASEERYRSIFDDSPVALIEFDASKSKAYLDALSERGVQDIGTYLDEHVEEIRYCVSLLKVVAANAALIRLYGEVSEEALPAGLMNRFDSDEGFRKTFRDGLVAAQEGRATYEYESSRRLDGGGNIHEFVRWSVPADHEKTWEKLLVSITDITALKEAEAALHEFEERYRVAIESSNDGVALSRRGEHLFVNEKFCEMFGYTRQEALGLSPFAVVHPDDRETARGLMAGREKGEHGPSHYELTGVRKDGAFLDVEVSVAPVLFRGDRVFLVYFRDITEQKRAADLLRMNEKRLQTLMDVAPVGISWADPSENLLYCNKKFTQLFGYTAEDIPTYEDWRRRAYPDPAYRETVRPLVPAVLEAQQNGEYLEPMEVMIACKDSSTRWVSQTGASAAGVNLAVYTDVTERKRAEESLRESENKFKDLAEKSVVGIYLMEGGLFRYVNSRFAEIHGYEVDELIDRKGPPDMFAPEGQWQLDKASMRGPGELGVDMGQQFKIMTKQGGAKNIEVYSSLTSYQGRKAVIGTVLDITERKAVEEALRSKTAFLEALLYTSPDGILVADGEGKITLANPRVLEFWKIPEDVARAAIETGDHKEWGKYVVEMVKEPERFRKRLEYLRSHPDESFREEIELVDGTILDRYTSPVVDKDGVYYGRIFGYHDITERREWERLLDRVVQSSPMGIFIRQKGKTQLLNVQFRNIIGYTYEEALGMNLLDLVHPDDKARVKELGRKMVRGEASEPYEYRIVTKSGEIKTLLETVTPIHYEGKRAVLGNVIDTTDRKKLESQLAQSQKLEAIGQLAAGIAHEINTPIQYVGDNVTFLRDAFRDTLEILREYAALARAVKEGAADTAIVTQIEGKAESIDLPYLEEEIPKAVIQSLEGVGRVAKIVLAMREFSHPGTKEKSLVDINRAIENTVTVSRNEWKYVSEMSTDFDPSLPLVPCLPGEFNQVILNIIVNAAQAMGEIHNGSDGKGMITITTRLKGDTAEIRVSDTGPGIPESIRSRIFDPFFTTKKVGKGTGQGLAIARSVIVDKHRGTIECETRAGKGTTFVIRLPLADRQKGE
jgi:PAS domain S-box-containing protein